MSDYCRDLMNIDVHVGTPSSDYPHFARATVHFHGFRSIPSTTEEKIAASPSFSCLGFDWALSLQIPPCPQIFSVPSKLVLAYLSNAKSKITYTFKVRNSTTMMLLSPITRTTFACGKTVKCELPAYKKIVESLIHGALVIEVLMRPSNYPFHPFIPVNPSSCKTVQDLFNDEEFSDIVFEVGGGSNRGAKKGDEDSTKFYAHRNILKKAAPLLADMISSNDSSSLVKIPNVSPSVFGVLLRYVYGCDVHDVGHDSTLTMEIIDIANKYGVTNLKLQAEAYMVSATKFDAQNLVEILNFADAKNCALLKEAAMLYATENPSEIVKNVPNFPEALAKDIFVAMAGKETKKQAVRELSTMSVGELRHKARAKGLEMDGSREMLISALTQHDKSDDETGIGS